MEYYTTVERNELAPWVLKWITLKNITLRQKSITEAFSNGLVTIMDFRTWVSLSFDTNLAI